MKILNRKAWGVVSNGRNTEELTLPVALVNTRLAFFENVQFAANIKFRGLNPLL